MMVTFIACRGVIPAAEVAEVAPKAICCDGADAPIGEYEVVEVLALDLAEYFKTQNTMFNDDLFLQAVYTGK